MILLSCAGTLASLQYAHISPKFLYRLPLTIYQESKLARATGSNTFAHMPEKIVGKHVTLTRLRFSDRPLLAALYSNTESVSSFFVRNGVYLGPSQAPYSFVNSQLIQQYFGSLILYVVTGQPKDNLEVNFLGIIGAEVSNVFERECEILGVAYKQYWGRGHANESTALFLEKFFNHTPWESILATPSPHNSRCHAFLLKSGFTFSHIAQEHRVKNQLLFRLKKSTFLESHHKDKVL